MAKITVVRNEAAHRYEASVDGHLAGFARFRVKPGLTIVVHTEVDPAFEGRGIGSVLAGRALDDIHRRGEKIVPVCPFFASYLERHPGYEDLVASE